MELTAYPTGIADDGLTLYLDIHPEKAEAYATTRTGPDAAWGKPAPVTLALRGQFYRQWLMAACPIPGDESAITGNLIVRKTVDSAMENRPAVLSRPDRTGAFSLRQLLVIPTPAGEPGRFFNPRYVPATRELVFQSNKHYADPEAAKRKNVDLWMVRGFDLKGRAKG